MLSPLQTEKGPFILASVVDVTERRRLEQATARQRDELAHLSRVALLGELSGSLAHELNQPLTAILSNAQAAQRFLAQSPPRTDKLAEILTDIVKANHRAGSVIVRLRSMLRKEESKRLVLNLNHVVEESLRLLLVTCWLVTSPSRAIWLSGCPPSRAIATSCSRCCSIC